MPKFTKYKWRLYADNNIEREVVDFLRTSSFDVLWLPEVPELQKQRDDSFHYQKAREMGRILLTHDPDFWSDQEHLLKDSPGVIILASEDVSSAKYLPMLLRKLLRDNNPFSEPLYLNGIKVKMSTEAIALKMVDHDTQKVTIESWTWAELS